MNYPKRLIMVKPYGRVLVCSALMLVTFASISQRSKRGDGTSEQLKLREAEFYFVEGEKFCILEDYAKALVYFQKVVELNPANATVYYKIADVLSEAERSSDLSKAAVNIEQAIKLEKHNKYFYLLAANIFNELGRLDKAAQSYEDMIREVPGTEEYLYDLAAVYQYAGKPDDALKTYARAEQVFGMNETSSLQKQKILIDKGKIDDAIEEGKRLIAFFPDEERFLVGFADMLSKNDKKDMAISYLEKGVEAHDDFWSSRMLLAGLYRESNNEQRARELLLEIFESRNSDLQGKLIMLTTYNTELSQEKTRHALDTEKASFAARLFEYLKQDYPGESTVHILGGDLYLTLGEDNQALEAYRQALALGASNFEVWQNLIYLEMGMQRFDAVIEHAEQALELFPNQSILYYLDGFAYLRKQRYQDAISALEEARKRSPTSGSLNTQITALLGDAYHAVGSFEKSDEAYEAALTSDPNNDVVLNNYSYYLALRKANLEKAERMSAQLTKTYPDNPTYLDTYAWVLYMRGKYREARKTMERAIATGKATATHFEHYGDILFRLGEVDEAVQQWIRAKGMNATSELLEKKIANRKIYEQ